MNKKTIFLLLVGFITLLAVLALVLPIQAKSTEQNRSFDPDALYLIHNQTILDPGELVISANGSQLYSLRRYSTGQQALVYVVNTTTYAITSIPLGTGTAGAGFPIGATFSPDGTLLYITVSKRSGSVISPGSNRVEVINTTTNNVVNTFLTGNANPLGPTGIVLSLDGSRAYVSLRGPSQVLVIDTNNGNIIKTIAVGLGPMTMALTPDGSRLYVANREGNSVSVIDTVTDTLITTIPLSIPTSSTIPSIAITADGTRAYVANTTSTVVAVLDLVPSSPTYHQEIAFVATTGSRLSQLIVTPDDHYALITSENTNDILILDIQLGSPTYHTQVSTFPIGNQPVSIVLHKAADVLLYATNMGDDTISVIGQMPAITGLAAANDGPTVLGSSTHLTATISAGTDVTYTWAFGDGTTGSGITATHTYPALGSYTAVVTATNQVSQMTAATTVHVVDVPVSGLTASNSSPTIIGNQTFLAAATSGGTNIQYTWAFGDGTYGNGINPTHTYPAVGNYTAIVTATNTNNSLTASTQVQIIDVAISGLAAANDSPTLLGNATHLFATVSGGTNIQYSWAFGDGLYGNGASPVHIYPAMGNYTAIVTATNSNNVQTASTLVTITVEPSISFVYLPLMNACQATPIYADVVLVIDTSGSMGDPTEPGGTTKLEAAQGAAATFFSLLNFSGDQAALVSFDDFASLDHPLSQDEASLLNALNALQLGNQTRMDLGLQTARLELTGPRHDPDNQTVIIFLTDGYPNGTTEAQVLLQATLAKNAGITLYTIGLGSTINTNLLQNVASNPAYYYPSPSTDDLNAIYQQIAGSFACR